MSTVEKSQDTAWKDVLDTKGLSAAAPILEEYGLSCESDMLLVDEEDLVVLCSKLKQFQSKLLRKWVQGLDTEQRAAAFMKDASAANKHSTSPCVCVCVCVCVRAVQSIFESILEYLSIYLPIYLRMYLSICSWSLQCQRCLCWSLPFVCVCVCVYYCSTYENAVRVGGLVCVCVSFNYFALVLSLCCSTGVAAQQVFVAEHSGVSLLCKQSILDLRI
jgi:hypothetical protein